MIKFNIFGIRVEISFLAVCLLSFLLATDRTTLVFWGIFASFVHEVFHIFSLCAFSAKPLNVKMEVLGFRIKSCRCLPLFKEILVLASGCFGNFILFLICLKLRFFFGAVANFCLFAFNILPHEKLDGGNLLFTVLDSFLKFETAYRTVKFISVLVSVVLLVFGIFCLIWFKNALIFLISATLFLYLFL